MSKVKQKNCPGTKPSQRSEAFVATRASHSEETAEDYTELILDLTEIEGEARVGRIAECLGVSHVTALRTISRLQQSGLVNTENRAPVKLTAKGKQLASYCKTRHSLLLEFLISLGVPEEVAEVDVEGMEHHISQVTLDRIKQKLAESSGDE